MIKTISTTPYNDQKMGTAGLRKKSRVAMQPNYVENFMQSIFNTIGKLDDKTFLVGGDGRFYNDVAIQKIIKIAVHGKECCIGVKINVKRFFVCTLTILVDHLPRKRIFVCVFTEFV